MITVYEGDTVQAAAECTFTLYVVGPPHWLTACADERYFERSVVAAQKNGGEKGQEHVTTSADNGGQDDVDDDDSEDGGVCFESRDEDDKLMAPEPVHVDDYPYQAPEPRSPQQKVGGG